VLHGGAWSAALLVGEESVVGGRVKHGRLLFSLKVFHIECVASRFVISTFRNSFNKIRVWMNLEARALSSEN